jgi:hypothetical protein
MVYEAAAGPGQDPVKGFCEHSGLITTGNFLVR